MSVFHPHEQGVIVSSLNQISDLAKGELRAWLEPWLQTRATTTVLGTGGTTGPAGGVLAGSYPNPGFAVDMATQTELDSIVVWEDIGSGAAGVTYGTTPPASPVEGQLWLLPADASKGVMWMLRYRSGSASTYKWEFVGGTPLYLEVLTNDALGSSGTWVVDTNVLTAPRAGEYRVSFGYYCAASGASTIYCGVLVSGATTPGSATQTGATVSQSGVTANGAKLEIPLTLAASDTVHLAYNGSAATNTVGNRHITLRPIRLS